MAFTMYDASVPICAQQLGALAGFIGKAADHCATNKIEEAALLSDRLYPDMFCLAREIRQAADFGRMTPGRLAGVAGKREGVRAGPAAYRRLGRRRRQRGGGSGRPRA